MSASMVSSPLEGNNRQLMMTVLAEAMIRHWPTLAPRERQRIVASAARRTGVSELVLEGTIKRLHLELLHGEPDVVPLCLSEETLSALR
ncbi:hypothetical protein [Salinarimonas rosea]|uniref:hypothetical protein n=1 Tax=Salinarimonas rosea TaxID=552063 RepID=UPI00048A5210|nr:hypothetical protein [Salinarimonas rosea]